FDAKNMADGYAVSSTFKGSVTGVHDLPSDCNWITNIRPFDFKNAGLLQLRHLRSSRMFRTDLHHIQRELGLQDDPVKFCEVMYVFAIRMVRCLDAHMRESALKSPIAVSQTLTEIVLPGHIQDQSALNADDGVYDAV